ncbi:MAG: T9SS type A sorting domain-containing protein [Saprospiraceae bacterium]
MIPLANNYAANGLFTISNSIPLSNLISQPHMRILSLLLMLFFSYSLDVNAQQRDCGTMEYLEQQIQNSPKRAAKMEQIEKATKAYLSNNNKVVDGIITIPVVVHVVWNTAAENISTAQVQSQIDILTEDFRRLNSDADGTWPQGDDSEIEFCLATTDPNGNPTDGITRTNTSNSSFSGNDNVKFNSSGGHDAWPSSDYMNFWVCDLSGGLLGYAQFPGGPASTDGIVCDYQYVGDIGTATFPYELGRTATHEVGHWLNLYHIWGDGGCGVDDAVSDTPLSDASNGGCSTGHVSCGTVDMVQNYMDYSYDACMNLFTTGQKSRMRALFEPGGFRASLLNSTACGPITPPTCDDGLQNGQETGVDCGGPDCPECPPCEGTDVTLTIVLDDYPQETSWTITDAGGNTVASGGTYANQPDGSTIQEIICLADGCYDFTIDDTYGDGICCSEGDGSYLLVDDEGNVLASGGEFDFTETVNFCVESIPVIPGCTDPTAHNYNPEANLEDGSCEYCSDGVQNGDETGIDCGGSLCEPCDILGCTDPDAHNYNLEATLDDGSCETCFDGILNGDEVEVDCGGILCIPCDITPIPGCTNPNAHNYNPNANVDDDSCETCSDGIQNGDETDVDCGGELCDPCQGAPVLGCTDENAHNYNPQATQDDGSCETCSDEIQNGDETGIDCGGELCEPCTGGCNGNLATLNISFDKYPEETSWTLTDVSGNVVALGGTYGDYPDNSFFSQDICLSAGCYTLTVDDIFGDGLCCAYGEGSYNLLDGSGNVLASGAAFKFSESTNFCVGSVQPTEGCTDAAAHNYNEDALFDDGSCETCFDGILNGDEVDVDCGGKLCAPCDEDACDYETYDFNDLDNSWGIWNDGGSDCRRSYNDNEYANSQPYCIRLRDNSSSSHTTTENLDLSIYDELTVDFTFFPRSMENGEDFWLQISTDAGDTYETIASWARGTDFENDVRYFENVVIPGPFSNATRLRFRCDATSNADRIYLDDIDITGCNNGKDARVITEEDVAVIVEEDVVTINSVYPNPTSSLLNVNFTAQSESEVAIRVFDMTGKLIQSKAVNLIVGKQLETLNVSSYSSGIYFLHLSTGEQQIVKKFVVTR